MEALIASNYTLRFKAYSLKLCYQQASFNRNRRVSQFYRHCFAWTPSCHIPVLREISQHRQSHVVLEIQCGYPVKDMSAGYETASYDHHCRWDDSIH